MSLGCRPLLTAPPSPTALALLQRPNPHPQHITRQQYRPPGPIMPKQPAQKHTVEAQLLLVVLLPLQLRPRLNPTSTTPIRLPLQPYHFHQQHLRQQQESRQQRHRSPQYAMCQHLVLCKRPPQGIILRPVQPHGRRWMSLLLPRRVAHRQPPPALSCQPSTTNNISQPLADGMDGLQSVACHVIFPTIV